LIFTSVVLLYDNSLCDTDVDELDNRSNEGFIDYDASKTNKAGFRYENVIIKVNDFTSTPLTQEYFMPRQELFGTSDHHRVHIIWINGKHRGVRIRTFVGRFVCVFFV